MSTSRREFIRNSAIASAAAAAGLPLAAQVVEPVVEGDAVRLEEPMPATPLSRHIPLVMGNTREETTTLIGPGDPSTFNLTFEQLPAKIDQHIESYIRPYTANEVIAGALRCASACTIRRCRVSSRFASVIHSTYSRRWLGLKPSNADRALAFAMDDILLFGLMGNTRNPSDWAVVGDALQVEPYACMMRKDDPQFHALVNGVIGGMMKTGEFEKLYAKWFMSPVPPRGQNLNLPMSKELRENLVAQSDKPAQ